MEFREGHLETKDRNPVSETMHYTVANKYWNFEKNRFRFDRVKIDLQFPTGPQTVDSTLMSKKLLVNRSV